MRILRQNAQMQIVELTVWPRLNSTILLFLMRILRPNAQMQIVELTVWPNGEPHFASIPYIITTNANHMSECIMRPVSTNPVWWPQGVYKHGKTNRKHIAISIR